MRLTKKLFGTFASILFVAACSDLGTSSSALTGDHQDGGAASDDCTLTQGYWKNHASAWPVSSLQLGSVSYTKAELIEILKTPVHGDGLISLAHQLIAAKLNIAGGASDVDISVTIAAADALIGAKVCGEDHLPADIAPDLVDALDAYNSGDVGPGHCGDNDSPSCDAGNGQDCDGGDHDGDHDGDDDDDDDHDGSGSGSGSGGSCGAVCGNGIVEVGETCDDGNVVAHDGCSATCTVEVPVCGNGYVEAGEECDDGNIADGDGCSATCEVCACPNH